MKRALILIGSVLFAGVMSVGGESAKVDHQDFTSDPGWDALNNRQLPQNLPVTKQHFGWSNTNHAGGKSKGEIGGRVQRSATPATYAVAIEPRTLNDKLHAGGTFAVTQDDGTSGVLFGWFNHDSRGWRTPNSLGFRIDGNGGGYWVLFEYGTRNYKTSGGATFEGRYQTTKTKPFRPDGTAHRWSLDYDPAGNNNDGLITYTIDGQSYTAKLSPGHKADGATFDRFGIWNVQTTGGGLDVWYDDVDVDGKSFDFAQDPRWEGMGNDVDFPDRVRRPLQDFGFTPTHNAGGKSAGEMGGILWRDEKPAWYGGKVDGLTLDDELIASGTIAFTRQGSDSGAWLGWFNGAEKSKRNAPESKMPANSFLAISIAGPSRVGHYFVPGYRDEKGEGVIAESGPLIRPDGKPHRWTLHYDPNAAGGKGRIDMTFDDQKLAVELRPEDRKRGATFDHFGLFNPQEGGHYVELFVDDLEYTARKK